MVNYTGLKCFLMYKNKSKIRCLYRVNFYYNLSGSVSVIKVGQVIFIIVGQVTLYFPRAGVRWWTKAWFNNREEGEASVEIEREQAIRFIHDNIEKDAWLEEFFPKQMEVYHNAIEQTKEQLLKQINMI